MHIKRFNTFIKILVQFREGAIPRLPFDTAPKINSYFECTNNILISCGCKEKN